MLMVSSALLFVSKVTVDHCLFEKSYQALLPSVVEHVLKINLPYNSGANYLFCQSLSNQSLHFVVFL